MAKALINIVKSEHILDDILVKTNVEQRGSSCMPQGLYSVLQSPSVRIKLLVQIQERSRVINTFLFHWLVGDRCKIK